jgi:chromosome segregation ATPase
MITITEKKVLELEIKFSSLLSKFEAQQVTGTQLQEVKKELEKFHGLKKGLDELSEKQNALKDELSRQDDISKREFKGFSETLKSIETGSVNLKNAFESLDAKLKLLEKISAEMKLSLSKVNESSEKNSVSLSQLEKKASESQDYFNSIYKENDKFRLSLITLQETHNNFIESEKGKWVNAKQTEEDIRSSLRKANENTSDLKSNLVQSLAGINLEVSSLKNLDSRLEQIEKNSKDPGNNVCSNSLKSFFEKVDKQEAKLKSIEFALADVLGILKNLKQN